MTYRPLPDPNEIRDCDLESPEMEEGARLVECGERQLRMLRRMGDVGIELVERLGQIAMSGAGPASGDGAATMTIPATIDSIAGACVKLTQSLRRTLAMETRLSDELKGRRLGVIAARQAQDAELIKVVHECINENIEYAMTKAIRRERPDADRKTNERLLIDMFERLKDSDEFESRPRILHPGRRRDLDDPPRPRRFSSLQFAGRDRRGTRQGGAGDSVRRRCPSPRTPP